jgi:hypothetical protein
MEGILKDFLNMGTFGSTGFLCTLIIKSKLLLEKLLESSKQKCIEWAENMIEYQ